MEVQTNEEKPNKSLTKNSIFYLVYCVLNVVFPFMTGIYVARTLLPDSIGQVASAQNIVQYFVILAFLGIPTYGLREISRVRNDAEKLKKLFSELVVINFISTLFFGIIYMVLVVSVPAYRDNIGLYLVTGISLLLNFFNISWLYEGLEEFKFMSIRNIIFKVLTFALLVLMVRNPEDYLIYAAITVVGSSGNYILDVLFCRKKVKFTLKGLNLKRHMKSIMYLVMVNLAIEIYSLVDITMLGIFCDDASVAFYSYGMKIYRIVLQIINSFTIVLVPRIALYYNEKRYDEYNHLLTKTLKVIVVIAIPAIIGIFFVSDSLITMIYGDPYIVSSGVLKILSVMLLISPIGYLLGSRVMLSTGNENKMVIPVAAGAAVNVILNLILINTLGVNGAAIASLASEAVVLIVYLIFSHKKFKLEKSIINTSIKVAISAGIMALTLYGVSLLKCSEYIVLAISIIAGVGVYFILLLATREDLTSDMAGKMLSKLKRN